MRHCLEPNTVRAGLLVPGQPWRAVHFEPSTGSTNEVAHRLVVEATQTTGCTGTTEEHGRPGPPSPAWHVVLTDHQTGGRGRLGRAWQVPAGAAVAVSVIVPVRDRSAAPWLPLCAGLALYRSLTQLTRASGYELSPRLKWPNDVLLADDGNRKVSGILCELLGPFDSANGRDEGGRAHGGHEDDALYVVVGTGVNVDQTRAELPVDTATSLALAGAEVTREDLVVAYLRELAGLLRAGGALDQGDGGVSSGYAPPGDLERVVRGEYERACSTIGSAVRVHLPGGVRVEGQATGVDATGALVVSTLTGARSFAAGDVEHVRRADGRLA